MCRDNLRSDPDVILTSWHLQPSTPEVIGFGALNQIFKPQSFMYVAFFSLLAPQTKKDIWLNKDNWLFLIIDMHQNFGLLRILGIMVEVYNLKT